MILRRSDLIETYVELAASVSGAHYPQMPIDPTPPSRSTHSLGSQTLQRLASDATLLAMCARELFLTKWEGDPVSADAVWARMDADARRWWEWQVLSAEREHQAHFTDLPPGLFDGSGIATKYLQG